jgi:hypothetical protein
MRFSVIVVGSVIVTLVLVIAASAVPFRADYSIDSIIQGEGTWLTGSKAGEIMGASVSSGGDVDGDGVADFVVGTY